MATPNLVDEYEIPDLASEYEAPPSQAEIAKEGVTRGIRATARNPIEGWIAEKLVTSGGAVGDVALGVGIPIVGTMAGAPLGPGGIAAGGAAGSAAADALVQAREAARGERSEFAPGRTLAAGVVGAIPLGKAGTTVIQTIARRAGQGAVLGTGQEVGASLIDEGKIDFEKAATSGALGTLFGAGAGGVEALAPKLVTFLRGLGRKTPQEAVEAITEEIANAAPEEKVQLTEIQKRIQQMVGLDDRPYATGNYIGTMEGFGSHPPVPLIHLDKPQGGLMSDSALAPQTIEAAGLRVPPFEQVPPGQRVNTPLVPPGGASDSAEVFQAALDANTTPQAMEGLREQLRQQEIRANDFQRARFEEAGEDIRARQLGGEESIIAEPTPLPDDARVTMWRMGNREVVQVDIPGGENGRPLLSGTPEQLRAEGYEVELPRWMDEGQFSYAELKPKQRNETYGQGAETPGPGTQQQELAETGLRGSGLNGQEQQALRLSPQAQRIYDQYGFIDASLLRGLTSASGSVAGGVYGLTQGDTAEERIRNGLTYAVLGAGGGYMLGSAFRRAALNRPATSNNPSLQRIYTHLQKDAQPTDWKERIRSLPNLLRRELTTGMAPADKLPRQLREVREKWQQTFSGPLKPMSEQHLPLSRQLELVNGASGKAAVDVEDFDAAVSAKVKDEEYQDFQALIMAKRIGQRTQTMLSRVTEHARINAIPPNQRTPAEIAELATDPTRTRVADWTLDKVDDALQGLQAKLGPQRFAELDQLAAGSFQQEADKALRLMVASGRMSQEQYNGIKVANDFFAPFKVLEAAEEFDGFRGTRVNPIDTATKYTQALTGIDDPNFKIDDPVRVMREKVYQARILAEKNLKMRVLANLADEDPSGTVVKKLRDNEEAPRGMATVNWLDNGKPSKLAVSPEMAEVVKGLNPVETGIITRFIKAVNAPFRFLATGGNISFQTVNAPLDQARLALMSKYGVGRGDMMDTVRYPLDLVHALYSSIFGNAKGPQSVGAVAGFYGGYSSEDDPENKLQSGLAGAAAGYAAGRGARAMIGPNELYRRFTQSGAVGSTMQDMIERMAGGKSAVQEMSGPVRGVISSLQDVGKVIEETTKIMGFKRGIRIEGLDKLPPEQQAKKLEEIVSEVRNFAGSPDFSVAGNLIRALNPVVVFLNPRVQGLSEDSARLAGRDGGKAARNAWVSLATTFGLGSAAVWSLNQRPENVKDFEEISERERFTGVMIPRYHEDGTPMYFTNERGEKVREYHRMPLRDTGQSVYQLTQAALDFAKKEDPDRALTFAAEMAESLSPINIQGENMAERIESIYSGLGPVGTIPYMIATGRNPGLHREIVLDADQKTGPAENQYTTSTPNVYRRFADAAPQWVADPLRSPLMLEAMIGSATGGVFNQFNPPKPLADRDPMATALQQSPLGRRFVRSTYVDSNVPKELKQAVMDQSEVKATNKRDIRALYDELMALPAEERQRRFNQVTPEESKGLFEEFKRRARRPSDNEIAQIKVLNVENGARAQYIWNRVARMEPDERREFIQDLDRSNLLSDNVKRQIAFLASRQNQR